MLDNVNNAIYEVKLVKAQIEHNEPIIVELFILQYAKIRMLKLYCNFFTKICDLSKFEELEMITDSRTLLLPRGNWKTVYDLRWKQCEQMRPENFTNSFTADAARNFFPACALTSTKKNVTCENLIFSKRKSCVRKCCVFVVNFTAATTLPPKN